MHQLKSKATSGEGDRNYETGKCEMVMSFDLVVLLFVVVIIHVGLGAYGALLILVEAMHDSKMRRQSVFARESIVAVRTGKRLLVSVSVSMCDEPVGTREGHATPVTLECSSNDLWSCRSVQSTKANLKQQVWE